MSYFQRKLLKKLNRILLQGELLMAKIDDLEAAVKRETDAEESVLTLLQGIVAQLKDAQNDPARLDAVIASIEANTNRLSAAVTSNTPQA